MISSNIKIYFAGEPGTLGAVCNLYFENPEHEGCPFRKACVRGNDPAKDFATLRILCSVDAETLEAMAKAIRATTKEVNHEEAI
jgi:hypothetical protein